MDISRHNVDNGMCTTVIQQNKVVHLNCSEAEKIQLANPIEFEMHKPINDIPFDWSADLSVSVLQNNATKSIMQMK